MLDDRPGRLNGDEGFLGEEELLRLAGLRFEKRRSEWLLGRWTAKRLLQHCLDGVIAPTRLQIFNDESGQPYVVDDRGERMGGCLSISHRAGRALCAWTPEPCAKMGADLELLEPRDPIFIEDYLGTSEKGLALACNGVRRDLFVTLAWSAKEAVFKALGTGLRMDTRSVEVRGLDWLAKDEGIPQGWLPLEFPSAIVPLPIQGWWRLDEDLIQTIALIGTGFEELVRV